MMLLVLLTSVIIALVTIYQYSKQTKENNIKQFEIKEDATKQDIEIELLRTSFPVTTENLQHIFQDRIYDIARVHKVTISMYDIPGCLLKTSIPVAFPQKQDSLLNKRKNLLSVELVNQLANSAEHRILKSKTIDGITYQSSYSYITNTRFRNIGILELRIAQNNKALKKELKDFLEHLFLVYLVMFFLSIFLAYFLSIYITRTIKTIAKKIKETRLNKQNEKIKIKGGSSEINELIKSYNNMIDQLEDSAKKLAKSEREQAWREMAKQVAHEIKNPLTPMRLSVQNFERKFDPNDPDIKDKLKSYSQMLIQQIDVMSSIASAFSDFAKMPKPDFEELNLVDVVRNALNVFTEDYIHFSNEVDKIIIEFDKTQLIRIITNLVKNAKQSMRDEEEHKRIEVKVSLKNEFAHISVSDNGIGISQEHKQRIFEPKFTTKNSGMGLGLSIVKNIIESYGGHINFESTEGVGSVFYILIPKK